MAKRDEQAAFRADDGQLRQRGDKLNSLADVRRSAPKATLGLQPEFAFLLCGLEQNKDRTSCIPSVRPAVRLTGALGTAKAISVDFTRFDVSTDL